MKRQGIFFIAYSIHALMIMAAVSFLLLGNQLISAGESGRIAFNKFIDGNWQIVVTDENGQNMINLSNNNVSDVYPAWSFDGKYIAFASDRDEAVPRETFSLYIMNADGYNQPDLQLQLPLMHNYFMETVLYTGK